MVNSVSDLKNVSLNKLIKINGIGAVKAIEFLAALELGRRVYELKPLENDLKCNSAHKIYNHCKSEFSGLNQEYFYCLYLNSGKKLIDKKLLFKGTLNKSLIHPREIFKEAYLSSAAYIICIHNHPSGDITPSTEDIRLTKTIMEIGELQNIPVLDHIIIGNNTYFSFLESKNRL